MARNVKKNSISHTLPNESNIYRPTVDRSGTQTVKPSSRLQEGRRAATRGVVPSDDDIGTRFTRNPRTGTFHQVFSEPSYKSKRQHEHLDQHYEDSYGHSYEGHFFPELKRERNGHNSSSAGKKKPDSRPQSRSRKNKIESDEGDFLQVFSKSSRGNGMQQQHGIKGSAAGKVDRAELNSQHEDNCKDSFGHSYERHRPSSLGTTTPGPRREKKMTMILPRKKKQKQDHDLNQIPAKRE
mmetsp:Transcript_55748/g.82992  ORF Transcript_55748/g.82992 Transcript_55748/m.82992 type:complete len:239 (+) Transcript_55748:95-811(+)